MIDVLIVDDQELIRAGMASIVDAHPETRVVGSVADGLAALDLMTTTRVDVVLLDLRMPGLSGVEVVRRIRADEASSRTRIIILTTFDQDQNVVAALRAGADGFFGKGAAATEILQGILDVVHGEAALSAKAVRAVVSHVADADAIPEDPEISARMTTLTARERQVVQAMVSGLQATEIAQQLFLSPYTVKTHTNRAMMKIGARDRGQLVSLAVRGGMVP